MAHLSSCYFCGSALDTPVQTYELPGPGPENRATVSLCSACTEKLDIVLDSAGVGPLSPVTDRSSPAVDSGTVNEQENGGLDVDEQLETSEDLTADGDRHAEFTGDNAELDVADASTADEHVAEDDGSEDTTLPDDSEEVVGVDAETGNDADEADDGGLNDPFEGEELLSDDDPLDTSDGLSEDVDGFGTAANEEPTAEEPTEHRLDSEQTETEQSDTGQATEQPDTGQATEQPDTGQATEQPDTGQPETGESDSDQPETDESGSDGETDTGSPSKQSISALEYNRVMRMLQNREFPVDRTEIVVVAANAYDLAESECAQVIDLAVDRGLLDERDGELYRPQD